MITIIYPYRNRELSRIKKSLDSLVCQSNKNFCVVFVDYGSDFQISASVKELLSVYKFVNYIHSFHNDQPWSRSKAINIGLRLAETEYVFIADIDIIFHKRFIDILSELKYKNDNIYFQVGYLDELETKKDKEFDSYKISFKSIPEGQGLSFFKLNSLINVGGFDEFFHFWGAEDEDVHLRLNSAGFSSKFYDKEILLLHQWHEKFASLKENVLTIEPRLSGIFNLNKQKMRFNQQKQIINPNKESWGKLINEKEYFFFNAHSEKITLVNKKHIIENFINVTLPNTHGETINVIFKEDAYLYSFKYKIKKFFRIKKQDHYPLKKINDLLLKTLIIYYQHCLYTFKVSDDLKSIELKIKK